MIGSAAVERSTMLRLGLLSKVITLSCENTRVAKSKNMKMKKKTLTVELTFIFLFLSEWIQHFMIRKCTSFALEKGDHQNKCGIFYYTRIEREIRRINFVTEQDFLLFQLAKAYDL